MANPPVTIEMGKDGKYHVADESVTLTAEQAIEFLQYDPAAWFLWTEKEVAGGLKLSAEHKPGPQDELDKVAARFGIERR